MSDSFPVDTLLAWYDADGRHDLPWRRTRDPYAVLVSEIMLQQTQVERVVPYYESWLERWPNATALAEASLAEVIRAWAGLGYNRRARNLHLAARAVRDQFDGVTPVDVAALRLLPGVGPYTASAVASFAGEAPVSVVDTNVGRVHARHGAGIAGVRDVAARELTGIADAAVPEARSRDFNLGLMDLGAMVCTARTPACERCPVAATCSWLARGRPDGEARRRRVPKFETTARFARGRIVAVLRERAALPTEVIAGTLPAAHAAQVERYLAALERDGLVQLADGAWSLSGEREPGNTSIASPKL